MSKDTVEKDKGTIFKNKGIAVSTKAPSYTYGDG